jgi:hypothetical protein
MIAAKFQWLYPQYLDTRDAKSMLLVLHGPVRTGKGAPKPGKVMKFEHGM